MTTDNDGAAAAPTETLPDAPEATDAPEADQAPEAPAVIPAEPEAEPHTRDELDAAFRYHAARLTACEQSVADLRSSVDELAAAQSELKSASPAVAPSSSVPPADGSGDDIDPLDGLILPEEEACPRCGSAHFVELVGGGERCAKCGRVHATPAAEGAEG